MIFFQTSSFISVCFDMKSTLVVWCCLNAHFLGCFSTNNQNVSADDRKLFKDYVDKFNKTYRYESREYEYRFEVFKDNLRRIEQLNHNTPSQNMTYGINKFSDLTDEEFRDLYLRHYNSISHKNISKVSPVLTLGSSNAAIKTKLPLKVDWRDKGIITGVRNQGSCGGCWAFSAVEMIESMNAKQKNKTIPLSVQQVIDCSYGYHHVLSGCKGGDICTAIDWIKQSKVKLVKESEYPTTDKPGQCKYQNSSWGVGVTKYKCLHCVGQESVMQSILATTGPVSVSVEASTWKNYLGGIIRFHCGEVPNNHAVIIVGYDRTAPVPYYIAKNSWGKDFGNDGYIYIEMDKNVCGVAEEVSTATPYS